MLRIERATVRLYDKEKTIAAIRYSNHEDLCFRVKTYTILKETNGTDIWEKTFEIVNRFFASLSKEDQEQVYQLYKETLPILSCLTKDNALSVTYKLMSVIHQLNSKIDLANKIVDFTISLKLPLPDLTGIGSRAQDTPELTFVESQYDILTAMTVVSKIFCPIWGEFIFIITNLCKGNTGEKELYCGAMIESILEHPRFIEVHTKLKNYASNTTNTYIKRQKNIQQSTNRNLDFSFAFSGQGINQVEDSIYAVLITKKLAMFRPSFYADENNPPPNIMKSIDGDIRRTAVGIIGAIEKLNNGMLRLDRSSSESHDIQKSSTFELEAAQSRFGADVPVYIKVSHDYRLPNLLKIFNTPIDLFAKTKAYYLKYIPEISLFSDMIISLLFAEAYDGSANLKFLKLSQYLDLLVITQIYMTQNCANTTLIHLLSCKTAENKKETVYNSVDTLIKTNFTLLPSYRACVQYFPITIGKTRIIEKKLNEIIEWFIYYDHFYNTAEYINNLIDEEAENQYNRLITYDETLASSLFEFIISECNITNRFFV